MSDPIDLRTFVPAPDVFREDHTDVSDYTAEEWERILALTADEKIALAAEGYWRAYEQTFSDFSTKLPKKIHLAVIDDDGERTYEVTRARDVTETGT